MKKICINAVAFFMYTGKKLLLYFLDDSMNKAITCFDVAGEKWKKKGTWLKHYRYTRNFSSGSERAKEWEKLFTEKLIESTLDGNMFHVYSSYDDMLNDSIFENNYDGENELLYIMKKFFGKIPVPYKGNKYQIEHADENFQDELDRERYEKALKTIKNNEGLMKMFKERETRLQKLEVGNLPVHKLDDDEEVLF